MYYDNMKILLVVYIYYNLLMSIDTINPFMFLIHQNYNVAASALGIELVFARIASYVIIFYIFFLLAITLTCMLIPQEFNFQYRWVKRFFSQLYIHNTALIVTMIITITLMKQSTIYATIMMFVHYGIISFCQRHLGFSEMLQTGVYIKPLLFNNMMYITCVMIVTIIRVLRNHEYFIIPGITLMIQSFAHGEITGYSIHPNQWLYLYSIPSILLIYTGILRFVSTYHMIYQYVGIITMSYIAAVQICLMFLYRWRYWHFQSIRKKLSRCNCQQEVNQQFVVIDGHLILQDFIRSTFIFRGTLCQELYKRYKLYVDVYEQGLFKDPSYLTGATQQTLLSQLILIHDLMAHTTNDLGAKIVADHCALTILYDNSQQIEFNSEEPVKSDWSQTQKSDSSMNLDFQNKTSVSEHQKDGSLQIMDKTSSDESQSSVQKNKTSRFNIFAKCRCKSNKKFSRALSIRERFNSMNFKRQLSLITGSESMLNIQDILKSSMGRQSDNSESLNLQLNNRSQCLVNWQQRKCDLKAPYEASPDGAQGALSQSLQSPSNSRSTLGGAGRPPQTRAPDSNTVTSQSGPHAWPAKGADTVMDLVTVGSTIMPTRQNVNQVARIRSVYSIKSLKSLQSIRLLQTLRPYRQDSQTDQKSLYSSQSTQQSEMTQIFVGNNKSRNNDENVQVKLQDDLKFNKFLQQLLYEHTGIWSVKGHLLLDDRIVCDLIEPGKLEQQPGRTRIMPLSRYATQMINEAIKQINQQSERYLKLLYNVEEVSQKQYEASTLQIQQFQEIHHARSCMVASVMRLQKKVPYSLAATWATAYVYGTILLDRSENLHRLTHDLMELSKNRIDLMEPKAVLEQLQGTHIFGNTIIEKIGSKSLVKRPIQMAPQIAVCDSETPLCALTACGLDIGHNDLGVIDYGLLPQHQAKKRRGRLCYGIEQFINYLIPVVTIILAVGSLIKQQYVYSILDGQEYYTIKQPEQQNNTSLTMFNPYIPGLENIKQQYTSNTENYDSLFDLTELILNYDYPNQYQTQDTYDIPELKIKGSIQDVYRNINNYVQQDANVSKQCEGKYKFYNQWDANYNSRLIQINNGTKNMKEITLNDLVTNKSQFRLEEAVYRIQKIIQLSNQKLDYYNCPQIVSYIQSIIKARYYYYTKTTNLYELSHSILSSGGIIPNHIYSVYTSCQDVLANINKTEDYNIVLPGINQDFVNNYKLTFDYLSQYNTDNQIFHYQQMQLIHKIICFTELVAIIASLCYGYIRYQFILRKFQFVRYIITKIQYIKFRILDEQKREVHQYIKCLESSQCCIQDPNQEGNKNNSNKLADKKFTVDNFITFNKRNIRQYIVKFILIVEILFLLFYSIYSLSLLSQRLRIEVPSQLYEQNIFNQFVDNILQVIKYDHYQSILQKKDSYNKDLQNIKYNVIQSDLYKILERYNIQDSALQEKFNQLIYVNYLICKIESLENVTELCQNRKQILTLQRFIQYIVNKGQYMQFFNQKFTDSPFLLLEELQRHYEPGDVIINQVYQIKKPIVINIVNLCFIGITILFYPKYKMTKEYSTNKKLLRYYILIPIYLIIIILIGFQTAICLLLKQSNFKYNYISILDSKINDVSMLISNNLNKFIQQVLEGTMDQQYICIFYINYLKNFSNSPTNKQIIDQQLTNSKYDFQKCQNYTLQEQLQIYEETQQKYLQKEVDEIRQFIGKIEKFLLAGNGLLIATSILTVFLLLMIHIFMILYNRVVLVSRMKLSFRELLELIFKPVSKQYKLIIGVVVGVYAAQIAFTLFCLITNMTTSIPQYITKYQDLYQLRQIHSNIELNLTEENQINKYSNIIFYNESIQIHWWQYVDSNSTNNTNILLEDYAWLNRDVSQQTAQIQNLNIAQSVIMAIQAILIIGLYIFLDRYIFFQTESYMLQISDLIIQYLENVYNYDMYRDLTETRNLLQRFY